jgi:hypothetical protein
MSRSGFALPLALLLVVALGFVVTAAAHSSLTAGRIALSTDAFQRALAVADGGLERGVEQLGSLYEAGAVSTDTLTLVAGDSLDGFLYQVRAEVRREPTSRDLNGNGRRGEVVRYDRSWGYRDANAAGAPLAPGEPVWVLNARATGRLAAEELTLEVALERDPTVAEPSARGAWRVIRLRWSAFVGHR